MEYTLKSQKNIKSINLMRNINIFLVLIFIFFSVFTPADSLQIKKASLFILLIINPVYLLNRSLNKKYHTLGFHMFIFFPLIILISILSGGNISVTIASSYFVMIAGLNIIIERYKMNYEKYFFGFLTIMIFIIVGSFLLDVFGIFDIYNNSFLMYLNRTGDAMIGKSPIYWSVYILFFKASPLLIFLLAYYLFKRKYLLASFVSVALALTGTRANFFAMFIMLFIFLFIQQKKILLKLIILFLSILTILVLFEPINNYFSYMFVSKTGSTIDKMGDVKEIFEVFKEYPHTVFFGTGFGSEMKYGLSHTISEVSLIDLWRKIGFFGLLMFLYYIFKPILKIWKSKDSRWVVYSFILYLAISMTNPLFFSSTAYMAYVFIYYKYYELV